MARWSPGFPFRRELRADPSEDDRPAKILPFLGVGNSHRANPTDFAEKTLTGARAFSMLEEGVQSLGALTLHFPLVEVKHVEAFQWCGGH